MFGKLLSRLNGDTAAPLTDEDARLSMAALLVRVARSDGDYAESERDRILKILSTRYALSPFDVSKLMGDAEALEKDAPDTVRFTRTIKETVAYDDRLGVIEALRSVALADGERDNDEDDLLRMVANFLGVSDRDSNLARLRVDPSKA